MCRFLCGPCLIKESWRLFLPTIPVLHPYRANNATCLLLSLLFDPEDECRTFLRNVSGLLLDYTGLHPTRWYSVTAVRTSNPVNTSIVYLSRSVCSAMRYRTNSRRVGVTV
jgi:hypothetical protein